MPAPYQGDPPNGNTTKPDDMADAIYYAWLGIYGDPAIATFLCDIIKCGVSEITTALQGIDLAPLIAELQNIDATLGGIDSTLQAGNTILTSVNSTLDTISDTLIAIEGKQPELRDQFAMSALEALGSDERYAFSRDEQGRINSVNAAYEIANLMLIRRALP